MSLQEYECLIGGTLVTLAELIYEHSQRLPEQAAREALDFIEFLEQRYGVVAKVDAPESAQTQREALDRLDLVRVPFAGKPIPSRDALYDDSRS